METGESEVHDRIKEQSVLLQDTGFCLAITWCLNSRAYLLKQNSYLRTSLLLTYCLCLLILIDKEGEPIKSRDTGITDVYTVEDMVERMGFGWYQLAITLFSGSLWVSKRTMV